MGNLATSGICSLAFIHYQKLVPTLITVWPHNINNCYFFSQKNNKIFGAGEVQEAQGGLVGLWSKESF